MLLPTEFIEYLGREIVKRLHPHLLETSDLLKLCALEGIWLDVGRPEDLRHAEQLLAEK